MTWLYGFLRYGLPNVPSMVREWWDHRQFERRVARIRAAHPGIDAEGIIDILETDE
jgi:hypothetical protein